MIEIFFHIFFGWVCYKLAEKQGRNEILGAILGVLFNIFAMIGYLIIGHKR